MLEAYFDEYAEKEELVILEELSKLEKRVKVLQCLIKNYGIGTVCEEFVRDGLK